MKQIIQDLKNGKTILEEVPVPMCGSGKLLIKTTHSLVSLGTERMLVEFGKANLLDKAKQQPDRVKQVLDKMKTDGILPTLEAVFSKLGQPLPLGYCNVGEVVEVGKGVIGFNIGDRVASNGNHAEYVCVSENLVAKIPEKVSNEEAVFTVIGSIALQGIRLINPTLGENIVVIGLGLVGLMTVQLLKANGCNVIGIDMDKQKLELAKEFCVQVIDITNTEQVDSVMSFTNQVGADGVVITASANTNEIISNSAKMSRKRGRIVLVGVVGLDINRADFYEKELSFQVSCSYGPGRYDDNYEAKGNDYPLPYVRWTEKRNFEAVLNAINSKQINVTSLVTQRVPLADYLTIYDNMKAKDQIASVLVYPESNSGTRHCENESKIHSKQSTVVFAPFLEKRLHDTNALTSSRLPRRFAPTLGFACARLTHCNDSFHKTLSLEHVIASSPSVSEATCSSNRSLTQQTFAIIGSGSFVTSTILPNLKKLKAKVKTIASSGGLTGTMLAKKYGILQSTTDYTSILNDADINTVIVATRHNSHAKFVCECLDSGKNVFVEKPLAINNEQLTAILEHVIARGGTSKQSTVAVETNSKNDFYNIDAYTSSRLPRRVAPRNDSVPNIAIGYNRRHAPLAIKMKQLLGDSPMNIVATMNAGFIPLEHWVHDLEVGGGRIIGEACHFIDLCSFLTGSEVISVCMNSMGREIKANTDNVSILLKYENGSNAVINYFSNGSKAYSKERVEVYSQNRTLVMDNWRLLKGYGFKGFSKMKTKMDKGHYNQFKKLINGEELISLDSIVNTTSSTFAAIESLSKHSWINVQ